jgi:cell division protein FtsI (penicillin-binding protein 3)
MKSKVENEARFRLIILFIVVVCWMGLISVRMMQLGVFKRDFLLEKAKEQQEMTVVLDPKRGCIFDRQGRELAISIDVYSVYAVPPQITNIPSTATKLAQILSMDYFHLLRTLQSKKRFIWVKRKVTPGEAEHVRVLETNGIGLLRESKRFYPKKELASHVIGFVGMDNKGLEGLEHYLEAEIKGEPGKMLTYIDARRRGVLPEGILLQQPTGGKGVVLTIDEVIQHTTEVLLQKAVEINEAKSGSAIIMNPNNGEILAMANVPTYDPNRFSHFLAEYRRNRAITDCFEPGSTFKIAMAATALEFGLVNQEELFDCSEGSIMLAKHAVRDYKPFGELSFRDIIVFSSNVGAIQVGQRIDEKEYYEKLREFGFGQKCGIDLPGESHGILRPYYGWSNSSTGAISIGYEIAVTPLQLISFISAVANDGYLLKPKLIEKIITIDGDVEKEFSRTIGRRIFSRETAELLKSIMEGVVVRGTGKQAAINGYRIAGKTGTAQKLDPSGGYSNSSYTSSFVGFLPVSQPQIAIIIVIDEPKSKYYGGAVAAPVFSEIAKLVIRYMRIGPDDVNYLPKNMGKVALHTAYEQVYNQ